MINLLLLLLLLGYGAAQLSNPILNDKDMEDNIKDNKFLQRQAEKDDDDV